MVQLLKIKEQINWFIARYELYVMAAVRFVIAFAAFYSINESTGYMSLLTDYPTALILALACAFMPPGFLVFCGAVLILLQFYALSMELCIVSLLVFLILFFVYLRFAQRKGLLLVLTPLLGAIGVPYVMPVACGLTGGPYSVLSAVCGEVVYFMMKHVSESSAMFSTAGSSASIFSLVAQEFLLDQEMYLYLAAFAAAGITVSCIRRIPADHAHTAAVAVGIVIQMGMISAGKIYLGSRSEVPSIIVGCLISAVICFIIQFMILSLDYTRVERLQFEDDEYYYYVKAVPKAYVPKLEKKVKQIHTKHSRSKKTSRPKKTKAEKPDTITAKKEKSDRISADKIKSVSIWSAKKGTLEKETDAAGEEEQKETDRAGEA